MPVGPVHTLRLAASAARRALLRDFTLAAGRGLTLGGLAAIVMIGSGKLGLKVPDWPWVLGGCLGLGLVSAGAWAISRRWSVARGAGELDERLGLKDRLSTAVALAASGTSRESGPFADWAIADAERAAPSIDLRQAVPVRLDWTWGAWPAMAAIAIGAAMFVPVLPHRAVPARPEPTQAERAQAAMQIRQTADAIRQGLSDERVAAATTEQLRALEQLQNELAQGRVDPEQATVQAAKNIEDVARRMESDAAAAERQTDAIREQLAGAAAAREGESATERTSPLMDAIQRGDIKTAAEALARAAQREPDMSAPEREQLARDLDQLARAIEADKQTQPGNDRADPPSRTGDQNPPAEPGARQPDGERPDAAPESKTPDDPERQAPRPDPEAGEKPQKDQPNGSQQSQEQRERLRESLRDAARELRQEPKPRSDADRREREPPAGQRPTPGADQRKPDQSAPREGQQGTTGDQKENRSGEKPSEDGQKRGEDSSKPASGSQPQGQPGSTGQDSKGQPFKPQPGGQEPGTQPAGQAQPEQPGREQSQEQRGPGEGERQSPSGQPGATGATGASPNPEDSQRSPGESQASPEGDPKGNAPETGGKTPDAKSLERAARELKRLTDGSGQPDKERARQLREMARKMLEESTPEQREQLRKLAQEFGRQPGEGGPGESPAPLSMRPPALPGEGLTSPVDARQPATVSGNDKPPERTIAQWYSDKPAERSHEAAPPADVFRQAAQGAERAIEQQQVPGRYQDLVRRVFRRYAEQAPPK